MCLVIMASKSGDNGAGPSLIGISAPPFLTVNNSPIYSGIIELTYNHTPLPISSGGTGLTSIGSQGQVLSVISSTPTPQLGWISVSGTGTVTSVSLTLPSFLKSTISEITSSGVFDISLSGDALPISSGGTGLTTIGPKDQILSSDGEKYTWIEQSKGTVTSVSISTPSFLQTSTPTITSTGSFDISLSGIALPISSGGTGLTTIGPKGQILCSNGENYTWTEQVKGTVTNVSLSVPTFLKCSTSSITSSGTFDISLSDTPLPISSGGTGLTSIGSKDQILSSDGTNFTWKDPSVASVYSVGLTTEQAPFLSVTNTPITTAGTLSLSYTPNVALPISSGGTGLTTLGLANQILTSNGSEIIWADPAPLQCVQSISASLPLACTSGPNPQISIASSTGYNSIVLSNSPTISSATLINPSIGNAIASSVSLNGIILSGSTLSSYTLAFPSSIGKTGQILTSQGTGKPLTWTSPSSLPSDSILVQDTTITTLKPMIQKNGMNTIVGDTILTPTTIFQLQNISTSQSISLTTPTAIDILLAMGDSSPGTTFTGTLFNPNATEILWIGGTDVTVYDSRPSNTISAQIYILQIIDDQHVAILLK